MVHAVLRRSGPGGRGHRPHPPVPPFDVRAGAGALVRAVPHLGPGWCWPWSTPAWAAPGGAWSLETAARAGPPLVGGPGQRAAPGGGRAPGRRSPPAWSLDPDPACRPAGRRTFDGRDLFAPAAAALATGADPAALGPALDRRRAWSGSPSRSSRPAPSADGGRALRVEVTWVDRFGNVQLAAPGGDAVPAVDLVEVELEAAGGGPRPGAGRATGAPGPDLRRAGPDEAGPAGRRQRVAWRWSAAERLGRRPPGARSPATWSSSSGERPDRPRCATRVELSSHCVRVAASRRAAPRRSPRPRWSACPSTSGS